MASPPENPLVSVIVPAFNAESKLPAALDSVLAQTEVSWECLVIDDGSTDGTAGIVRNYEAKDSRFRLIQQENLGVGAARNSGLAQAKGEFIAPLDADDRWLPEKLAKQVDRMKAEGPDCGLVYCWSNRIDDQGAFMWRCRPFEAEGEVFDALLMWNFVGNASVPLYRASVLAGIRPYLTRVEQGGVQGCEDWELSLRMADCCRFAVVRNYLVDYRQVFPCMSGDVRGMASSYDVLIQRLGEAGRNTPQKIYRWSAGHFNAYLVSKAFGGGMHLEVFRFILKSFAADHAMLINRRLYIYGLKTCAKVILGRVLGIKRRPASRPGKARVPKAAPAHPNAGVRSMSYLELLQEHRWATTVGSAKETGGPPPC